MSLMFSRKILLSAIVAAFALAPSIASAATNLITNGDFSAGFTGFTTGYNIVAPTANSMVPEGNITITDNPIGVHSSWVDLGATGNPMLIANGKTGAGVDNIAIWQSSALSVVSGKSYNFSADVMNVCCNATFTGPNAASTIIFQISTNGGTSWADLASHTTIPGDAGVLDLVTLNGYLATSSSISLRAINTIDAASGNDFALDNLSFASAVPEPGTWAMLFLGFGAIGLMMRRRQSRGLAIAA
jgi:PEP-CTERM motif